MTLLTNAADLDEPYYFASAPTQTFPSGVVFPGVFIAGSTPPADSRFGWLDTSAIPTVPKFYDPVGAAWTTLLGPAGADSTVAGPAGQGLTWMGVWSSVTTYAAYELVYDGAGNTWFAVATSTNVAPGSDATKWTLVAAVGANGSNGTNGTNGTNGSNGSNGARGSLWYEGSGAPGSISGELANDLYLDTATGNVWQYSGSAWSDVGNILGPAGSAVTTYFDQTLTGSVDGSNVTFTLPKSPVNGYAIKADGACWRLGSDYTASGLTITCAVAPAEWIVADIC